MYYTGLDIASGFKSLVKTKSAKKLDSHLVAILSIFLFIWFSLPCLLRGFFGDFFLGPLLGPFFGVALPPPLLNSVMVRPSGSPVCMKPILARTPLISCEYWTNID